MQQSYKAFVDRRAEPQTHAHQAAELERKLGDSRLASVILC